MQKWRYLVVCEAGGLTDKSWRTSDGRTLRTKGNSNAAIDHFGFLNELGEERLGTLWQ